MGKSVVCDGDETTMGGHVIAKESTMFDGERRVALDREMATCGNCPGEYPIEGSGTNVGEGGRATVLDGDQVLCPCGRNHVKAHPNAGCAA
ncbi:PAAR domain-containing protein [Paraburkholderia adhaesiva]|uniref:PAAR domain-containing protein n=1 Tax=Paraburkholderia adhaesiva TaxID=2883244 RepID=UPI001F1F0C3C|nr:PAAR domain-containing protein [Paraburkholderia adhaesiva]